MFQTVRNIPRTEWRSIINSGIFWQRITLQFRIQLRLVHYCELGNPDKYEYQDLFQAWMKGKVKLVSERE
jgi:hypothetical protein